MNIKDLKPGSFQVTKQGTGAPVKLNINNLSAGSYTVNPPAAPKPAPTAKPSILGSLGNAAKGIGNFLTSSEQGFGADIAGAASAILPKSATGVDKLDQASQMHANNLTQTANLIKSYQSQGKDTTKLEGILKDEISSSPTQLSDLYPALKKTNWDVVGDAAGTLLDTLSAGTYGAAAKGLKTGELATKIAKPTAVTLGEQGAKKIAKKIGGTTAKDTLKVITPQLSKKETSAALAAGKGSITPILRKTVIAPSQRLKDVATAVQGLVKKGASATKNISSVKSALTDEATKLEKAVDGIKQPVSLKGATTFIDAIKKPIEIEADATQARKFDITKNALSKIITENLEKNPNVASLLKSRKEFDSLVDKEFPTLYDKTNSAFRSAVKAMRDGLNDAIEANLPDGFGYKESLKKQSLYYDAIDNIAEKSSEEVGTNKIGRIGNAIKKHPVGSLVTGGTIGEAAHRIITGNF